jgi:hypothetical protein
MKKSESILDFEQRFKFETLAEETQSSITKSGWLEKLTSKLIKTWQSKFCILRQKVFSFYTKKSIKQPAACLNFDQVQVDLIRNSPSTFSLSLVGLRRVFVFKSTEIEEVDSWFNILLRESSSSLSKIYKIDSLVKIPKFWLFPQISVFEFVNQCQTGDVLLFRSKNLISKAQRVVTRSSYDHVAVLINHMGYVALLEATRVTGVNLLFWTEFCERQWHLLYSRLVFRKLKVSNHFQVDQVFKNFVSETQGSKFNASLFKIFRKLETDVGKGVFCSELVALAYQSAGLLPKDVNASEYWPGNFANERPLYLINASLGPLTQINFDI